MSTSGFVSHIGHVIDAKNQALERAAEIIGGMAESYAKQYLTEQHAVDTGLLRNSITHGVNGGHTSISTYKADVGDGSGTYDGDLPTGGAKKGTVVIVGTNVEYAPHVELGTVKMTARPYLHPAIEDHLDEYKEVIETELQGR